MNITLNICYPTFQSYHMSLYGKPWGREQIAILFEKAKRHGVTKINWRATSGGVCFYNTEVGTRYNGDYNVAICKAIQADLEMHDPLASAVELAHQFGLDIFYWGDLFDCWIPGWEDPIMERHPHWHMLRHDHKYALPGIPCYNEPDLRKYNLSKYEELLNYGIDGLFLSAINTHSMMYGLHFRDDDPSYQFGFNKPVQETYQQKMGSPLRFPVEHPKILADILADGLDIMLDEVSLLCSAKEKKISFMTSPGEYLVGPAIPVVKIATHNKKWLKNKKFNEVAVVFDNMSEECFHDFEKSESPVGAWVNFWALQEPGKIIDTILEAKKHTNIRNLIVHEGVSLEYPNFDPVHPIAVKNSDAAWELLAHAKSLP